MVTYGRWVTMVTSGHRFRTYGRWITMVNQDIWEVDNHGNNRTYGRWVTMVTSGHMGGG